MEVNFSTTQILINKDLKALLPISELAWAVNVMSANVLLLKVFRHTANCFVRSLTPPLNRDLHALEPK